MSHVRRFDHVGITVADLDTVTAFFVGLGLEVEGTRMFVEASSWTLSSASPSPAPRSSCCGRPTEVPGWSSRASSGPTTRPDRPPRWPPSWGCATWPSRSTTSRPPSTGWPRTARAGRRHRPVRAHLADGLRARSGGDHRVPGRADRLTRRWTSALAATSAPKACVFPPPSTDCPARPLGLRGEPVPRRSLCPEALRGRTVAGSPGRSAR